MHHTMQHPLLKDPTRWHIAYNSSSSSSGRLFMPVPRYFLSSITRRKPVSAKHNTISAMAPLVIDSRSVNDGLRLPTVLKRRRQSSTVLTPSCTNSSNSSSHNTLLCKNNTPSPPPPAAAATAAAAGGGGNVWSAAGDLDPRVYTDPCIKNLEPFVGPMSAAVVPGKGRGLTATELINPGRLLLVTPPTAIVEGDLGEIPDHDDLSDMLTDIYNENMLTRPRFTVWQAQWLKSLAQTVDHSSSSSSSGAEVPDLLAPPDSILRYPHSDISQNSEASAAAAAAASAGVDSPLDPAGEISTAAAAAAAGATGVDDRVGFWDLGMSEEDLWNAIVLNCYGEGFPDLPATLCSGPPVMSHIGLWGPFSLLNHSCCPNAVNYTLRDSMVVRASRAIAPGDEITINYLGRGSLRPLTQRQEELEACYGFKCDCQRCQTESELAGLATSSGTTLGHLLDQIHEKIGTVYEPMLAQVLDMEQKQQVKSLDCQEELISLAKEMQQDWDELVAAVGVDASKNSSSSSSSSRCATLSEPHLHGANGLAATQSPGASAEAAAWTIASAFDVLGLLLEALSAAGQPDDHVITTLVSLCQDVCPGSDLHVFQALRRLSLLQRRQGVESDQSQQAMMSLVNALRLRYGQQVVDDQVLLQQMITAATRAADMVSF